MKKTLLVLCVTQCVIITYALVAQNKTTVLLGQAPNFIYLQKTLEHAERATCQMIAHMRRCDRSLSCNPQLQLEINHDYIEITNLIEEITKHIEKLDELAHVRREKWIHLSSSMCLTNYVSVTNTGKLNECFKSSTAY